MSTFIEKIKTMKKTILLLFTLSSFNFLFSQVRIDGSFSFQTDPAKKYSLYIPSGYDENNPHKLMIGFHPFNTSRWDAESWCDTLIAFAETNNLILACPDGGPDGKVDDPIDTAFTTVLIDSVFHWFNINPEKVYGMGFSWGGRTTYTYGLNHIEKFRGFIPIGAAVNGTSEVNGVIQNAEGKPYYLVHGSNDSPNERFTPLINALEDNNALVNSLLMVGVGHTIDFPNRNEILTTAYIWVDSVNCAMSTSIEIIEENSFDLKLYPNPITKNQNLILFCNEKIVGSVTVNLVGVDGKIVETISFQNLEKGENKLPFSIESLPIGMHFLQLNLDAQRLKSLSFMVH